MLFRSGSKQVEVVGEDEKRGFTVVVGISMSGDVLPFQVIYAEHTTHSLPTPGAPEYHQATEVLKFSFESGVSGPLAYLIREACMWLTQQSTSHESAS